MLRIRINSDVANQRELDKARRSLGMGKHRPLLAV